ncbi:MAG: hypothetical protein LBU89_02535 [Fibromonadaceae bacterium]|jgi:hypothetical protein|nr:hypothetical protein [Fibromonadaceae bacterium]
MKKLFLLLLSLQIISCGMDADIEPKPETTKATIQNESRVPLLNVRWNGTNFGNIEPGGAPERVVSNGEGYIFFEVDIEGETQSYRTRDLFVGEKHRSNKFPSLTNQVFVINAGTQIQSTLGEVLDAN